MYDAPAEWAHFAAKVRNGALSNVLSQIAAPLQLRQDQQYAHQVPKDRSRHILLVQLPPDQQFDLSGQVVYNLIPINHPKPSGGIIAQECVGPSCQSLQRPERRVGSPSRL